MLRRFILLLPLTLLASVASADPVIDGLTITYDDDGWYQVQDATDYSTLCDGGDVCVVPAGQYIIINHTTGERWEGVEIGDVPVSEPVVVAGLSVSGNTISWLDTGWYQVQSVSDYESVCEGGTSCELEAGVYNVINHDTGERWNNIIIVDEMSSEPEQPAPSEPPVEQPPAEQPGQPAPSSAPLVVDEFILWIDDGWYQVQDAATYETVCEGGTSCQVPAGASYIVINLDSGERWEGIEVPEAVPTDPGTTDPEPVNPEPVNPEPTDPDPAELPVPAGMDPVLEGNTLTFADDGWYQVQSASDYSTICDGETSCELVRGDYVVVNHTTGQRWENISVYGTAGVWFGTDSHGDAVTVVQRDGDVFSLSYDGSRFYEATFGNLDDGQGQQRFIHTDSRNPLHGTSLSLNGDAPSNFDATALDSVDYGFTVTNDGQQLDNTGDAGEFSLTYATVDDLGVITAEDAVGAWQARSAFCASGCDVTLSINIAQNGFLQGSTIFNASSPISLAGVVTETEDSPQYLEVSFVWNSLEHEGVIYRDRNSDRLILNAFARNGQGFDSFSGQLTRQ